MKLFGKPQLFLCLPFLVVASHGSTVVPGEWGLHYRSENTLEDHSEVETFSFSPFPEDEVEEDWRKYLLPPYVPAKDALAQSREWSSLPAPRPPPSPSSLPGNPWIPLPKSPSQWHLGSVNGQVGASPARTSFRDLLTADPIGANKSPTYQQLRSRAQPKIRDLLTREDVDATKSPAYEQLSPRVQTRFRDLITRNDTASTISPEYKRLSPRVQTEFRDLLTTNSLAPQTVRVSSNPGSLHAPPRAWSRMELGRPRRTGPPKQRTRPSRQRTNPQRQRTRPQQQRTGPQRLPPNPRRKQGYHIKWQLPKVPNFSHSAYQKTPRRRESPQSLRRAPQKEATPWGRLHRQKPRAQLQLHPRSSSSSRPQRRHQLGPRPADRRQGFNLPSPLVGAAPLKLLDLLRPPCTSKSCALKFMDSLPKDALAHAVSLGVIGSILALPPVVI